LRGEMKRYVKDMVRWGGCSANLCFHDRHTYNRVKKG
jgi:hypothetical protein